LKQSRRSGDEDRSVAGHHEHHFLIGSLFMAAGSAVLAVTFVPTDRAMAWWVALPLILVGANISARRTTPAGIRRDGRDVILSPIGQFLFAAELLLPPAALLAVALLAPTSRVFADSWLHRSQRAITMFAGSAAFWFIVDDSRGLTQDSNAYRTVVACVVAMIVHTMVEAALVSARVTLTNGDRATSSIVWTPYSALRDIWELSIGAVAALLAFEHPVLVIVVVPLCCLASEHIRLESRSRLALTDSRTGLLNPRGFEEVADHEWERAERGMHRISLVLVDLDLLREVNNVHGHRAGDAVIAAVGRILMSSSRSTDAVARLGGEEFALLLPDTDVETATMVGERLRETVAATIISTPAGPLSVTVSCGVATRVGAETMDALFDRADTALYDAKNGGRNRVSVASRENDDTRVARRSNAA
jgi:diguanylate cyclase (GGDEF)-like protein